MGESAGTRWAAGLNQALDKAVEKRNDSSESGGWRQRLKLDKVFNSNSLLDSYGVQLEGISASSIW